MSTRPTSIPLWAVSNYNNGPGGNPNKVQPPAALTDEGWHYKERPPRNYLNWWQNFVGQWLQFLDEVGMIAPTRTLRVDPVGGKTIAQGADGYGTPFLLAQDAIDTVVTLRGGDKAGTNYQWWVVSVAPGVVAENLEVYGHILLRAQETGSVMITGTEAAYGGVPCLLMSGSDNVIAPAPCAVDGMVFQRDDNDRAGDYQISVAAGAGRYWYDGATRRDSMLSEMAVISRCRAVIQPNSQIGQASFQRWAGWYVAGQAAFVDCDIEAPYDAAAPTADIECLGRTPYFLNCRFWPEQGRHIPITLNNCGMYHPDTVPTALVLDQTQFNGVIDADWDDAYQVCHPDPSAVQIILRNSGCQYVTAKLTDPLVAAADFVLQLQCYDADLGAEIQLVADDMTVSLRGRACGCSALATMTVGTGIIDAATGREQLTLDALAPPSSYGNYASLRAWLNGVVGRTAAFHVAASNSDGRAKAGADYICSGANDGTTINSAIMAAATLGGVVHLAAGTYYIDTTSIMLRSNVMLEGEGPATIIRVISDHVGVRNLTQGSLTDTHIGLSRLAVVRAVGAGSTNAVIDWIFVNGGVIEDVSVNCGSLTWTRFEKCTGIHAKDFVAFNAVATEPAIKVLNCQMWSIKGRSHIYNCTTAMNIERTTGEECVGIHLSELTITNTPTGVDVDGLVGEEMEYLRIDNLTVVGYTTAAVVGEYVVGLTANALQLVGGTGNADGVRLANSHDCTINGLQAEASGGDKGCNLNNCLNVQVNDIATNGFDYGVHLLTCTDCTIDDVHSTNAAVNGVLFESCTRCMLNDVLISLATVNGVKFEGCSGCQMNGGNVNNSVEDGVLLSTCSRCQVLNATIAENGTADVGGGTSFANVKVTGAGTYNSVVGNRMYADIATTTGPYYSVHIPAAGGGKFTDVRLNNTSGSTTAFLTGIITDGTTNYLVSVDPATHEGVLNIQY